MAMFSPYALAADYDAQMLDAALRKKQMENQSALVEQQAKKLLGEQIAAALGRTPGQIPQSPAPGQPSQPMQRPAAGPVAPQVPMQGGPQQVPAGGQAPAAGAQGPAAGGAQQPQQGAPQVAPQGLPGAALASPGSQFTWSAVLDGLQKVTGAKPEVIAQAVQDIMPELDKESARKARAEEGAANRQQKSWALIQTLQWRYDRETDLNKRAEIKADIEREIATMRGDTARDVARIGAGARVQSAQIGAEGREKVEGMKDAASIYRTEMQTGSREHIAQIQSDLKSQLGNRALDLKSQQIDDTMAVKQRALDLQSIGMEKKDAQFYAKLEVTKQLAAARNEVTRRGQDMVSKDRQAAVAARTAQAAGVQGAKMDAARQKAAFTTDAAVQAIDKSDQMIERLLENRDGMEQAAGPIRSKLLTVRDETAKFETDLKTLKGQLLMQAIAQLKAGTGTTGLGRITNYEAQTIQASMANLELAQNADDLRQALLNLRNDLSLAKTHVLQGYEQQYKPVSKPGSGPVPANLAPKQGGKEIEAPANIPVGGRKQVDGVWYEVDKPGHAVEMQ